MTDTSRAEAFVHNLELAHMAPDELAHFGVLGMKWGRRKPESVARDERQERNARNTRRKLAVGTLGASVAASRISAHVKAKRAADAAKLSEDHKETRALLKQKPRELSTKDVQKVIDRLQKEKKLRELNPDSIARGKKIVLGIIAASGTAILIYDRLNSPLGKKAVARGKKVVEAMGLKIAETIVQYA